ncbi:MAG: hypothetical protein ABI180_19905 [Microcoleus sp.]
MVSSFVLPGNVLPEDRRGAIPPRLLRPYTVGTKKLGRRVDEWAIAASTVN